MVKTSVETENPGYAYGVYVYVCMCAVEELVNISAFDALLLAAFKGFDTAVSLLLKHGVDANTHVEETSVLRGRTMLLFNV